MYSKTPASKRLEFRCPDTSCNPYLTFAALLMAGIDGIQNKIDPGEPADYDIFEHKNGHIRQVPGSLPEALKALEADHKFLLTRPASLHLRRFLTLLRPRTGALRQPRLRRH